MNRGRLKTDMQNKACWWKSDAQRAPEKPKTSRLVDSHTFADHVRGCTQERVSEQVTNFYRNRTLVGQHSMYAHGVEFLIV